MNTQTSNTNIFLCGFCGGAFLYGNLLCNLLCEIKKKRFRWVRFYQNSLRAANALKSFFIVIKRGKMNEISLKFFFCFIFKPMTQWMKAKMYKYSDCPVASHCITLQSSKICGKFEIFHLNLIVENSHRSCPHHCLSLPRGSEHICAFMVPLHVWIFLWCVSHFHLFLLLIVFWFNWTLKT